jgi:alanine racemase
VNDSSERLYRKQLISASMVAAHQRGAWLGVDLVALAENLRTLKRALRDGCQLMAVVKADAYGHGAVAIAQAALNGGATQLGVATVEEGTRLRRSGVTAPILVLGLIADAAVPAAIDAGLQLTLSSGRQVQLVDAIARGAGSVVDVHIKVNTGMTRVGCELHEAVGLTDYVQSVSGLKLVGVSSHFATAEAPVASDAQQQLQRFKSLTDRLLLAHRGIVRHIANSAGMIYLPESHLDMCRIGLAMYGHSPRGEQPTPLRLTPVISLRARVAQVKDVPAGATVGYGGTWVAPRATRLALLPVGYADGLPRSLSNKGHVLVRGQLCPIVGRVSMDQTVVDVGDSPTMPGEEVLVLGGQSQAAVSVERWAALDGTINYEILCGLGQRLPKVYYR